MANHINIQSCPAQIFNCRTQVIFSPVQIRHFKAFELFRCGSGHASIIEGQHLKTGMSCRFCKTATKRLRYARRTGADDPGRRLSSGTVELAGQALSDLGKNLETASLPVSLQHVYILGHVGWVPAFCALAYVSPTNGPDAKARQPYRDMNPLR